MDEPIRQRLVGAVVLVALGVIFIPMLFDDPNEGWLGRDEPLMPPPPKVAVVDIPIPEARPSAVPPEAPPPAAPPERPVARAPKDPQLSAPAPEAWAVQVGSFGSRENALRLRDRLRKDGFPAYVEEVSEGGEQTTRVRVGPEIDEAHARALRERLLKVAKLEGIVVRHR